MVNLYYSESENKRYTPRQIHKVCQLISETFLSFVDISKITHVSTEVVKSVYAKYSWKYISDQYDFSNRKKKA